MKVIGEREYFGNSPEFLKIWRAIHQPEPKEHPLMSEEIKNEIVAIDENATPEQIQAQLLSGPCPLQLVPTQGVPERLKDIGQAFMNVLWHKFGAEILAEAQKEAQASLFVSMANQQMESKRKKRRGE